MLQRWICVASVAWILAVFPMVAVTESEGADDEEETLAALDSDGDKRISLKEFLGSTEAEHYQSEEDHAMAQKMMQKAFELSDADSNGFLTLEELSTLGDTMDKAATEVGAGMDL
eukprot:TRINITY_DN22203_c0_g1_i3.p1 TRINITY_DN22203_c0_g1~~TRINITY_DN22203_c0_g1_i3.p1  ORF type:complete len:115 (+),score=29.81 TRINITY_DN22203_c0_g1_i3:122-466(+)